MAENYIPHHFQDDEESSMTFAELWDMFWSYKWWYAVCVFVCMACVALYIYKTPDMYVRTAKVIIDESEQDATLRSLGAVTGGAVRMRSNASVANEMEAFASPDLMQMVVSRLSLETSYKEKQLFREVDIYGHNPVEMRLVAHNPQSSFSFIVSKLSEDKLLLKGFKVGKDEVDGTVECAPGDTVSTPVGMIALHSTLYFDDYRNPVMVSWRNSMAVAKSYCQDLNVNLSNKESTVVVLSLEDEFPRRASDILSSLIDIYNEEWVKNKNRSARNTSDFINERLVVIEKELGGIEGELKDFKQNNNLNNVNALAQSYLEESSEYAGKAFDVANQLAIAEFIKDYLHDPATVNALIPANLGLASANVEAQISEYNDMVLQRDRLKNGAGDRNPMIIDLNNALASLRSAILRSIDNLVSTLELQAQKIRSHEQQILSRIASNTGQELELLSIERQQKVKESLYVFLLERREENEIAALVNVGNTRLIMSPNGSPEPVSPDKPLLLLVALVLGLGIPFAVIFVLKLIDTTVKDKDDLGETAVPVLAEIPLSVKRNKLGIMTRASKFNNKNCHIIVEHGKRDMMNEAFRVFRTNLDMVIDRKPGEAYVTMFTSFNPNAGKTFVIQNIAASMALKGAKVLLVDLDLRKATLSKALDKEHTGIAAYLNGKSADYHAHVDRVSDNLFVLPVGTLPPNPTELLLTGRFGEMMASLRHEYDYIFIDCPPIDVVADAAIITKHTDMTVFVVRSGLLDKRSLPRIKALYESAKYSRMALIVNGIDVEGRRSGYGYGYGYGYGNNE